MANNNNNKIPTIVIIGLSGAGLKTFTLLLNKLYPSCGSSTSNKPIQIIAIEKSRFAYWPPGSLRACVEPGFEGNVFGSFDNIVPKRIRNDAGINCLVKVVVGVEVLELDLDRKIVVVDQDLEKFGLCGVDIGFDFLVIATGSTYGFPCRPPLNLQSSQEVIKEFQTLQKSIELSKSIIIVGGGVVGLEFAGEVSYKYPSRAKKIVIVSSASSLLSDHSKYLASSIESQLIDRGVEIIYDFKVDLITPDIKKTGKLDGLSNLNLISNKDGSIKTVQADFIFLAIGNKPNSSLIPQTYQNPSTKSIKVNQNLQLISNQTLKPIPGIYAIGDVSDFNESKLYAALDGQADTVSKNILLDINNSPESQKIVHKPIHNTISIPLGAYGGASEIYGFTFGLGALATSLAKGRGLFLWMFRSMYPDQPK